MSLTSPCNPFKLDIVNETIEKIQQQHSQAKELKIYFSRLSRVSVLSNNEFLHVQGCPFARQRGESFSHHRSQVFTMHRQLFVSDLKSTTFSRRFKQSAVFVSFNTLEGWRDQSWCRVKCDLFEFKGKLEFYRSMAVCLEF